MDDALALQEGQRLQHLASKAVHELQVEPCKVVEAHEVVEAVGQQLKGDAEVPPEVEAADDVDDVVLLPWVLHM